MNAFGYLRVSGKGQVDGDGPERQKDAILRFCSAFAFGQPVFFYEKAVSGTVEAMDRAEFVRIFDSIALLRKVLGDDVPVCIVVENQSRLARDLMVQELLLMECAKRSIPVYSSDQMALTDIASVVDPTKKMLRQLFGVLAEWDKSIIVQKLRVARDRKRAVYGRCEGPLPYGETPHEKLVQSYLITLQLTGESYANIAELANYRGYRTRNGRLWTKGTAYQAINQCGVKPLRG